jgi:tRNA/rRNA methyltransferase
VSGPAIILVEPQLGENIGTSARAMLNCGLDDLRLVQPRDGWPNAKALSAASGADRVVETARVFDSLGAAIADLTRVYATTARPRDMDKSVVAPREAAAQLRAFESRGERVGVLFGPERRGLSNDDITLADAVIEVPLNPAYRSLNLAQAVLIVAYEWIMAAPPPLQPRGGYAPTPTTKAELLGLFDHLEAELDACGFLFPPDKRPSMVRNLRNMLGRGNLSEQEVRTLRGVISGLANLGRTRRADKE